MGPFSDQVSLSVESDHVYQHSVLRPGPGPDVPVPRLETVLQQTWFVSTVGVLAIFLILSAAGFVYVKRKYGKDKSFDHYDGKTFKNRVVNKSVFDKFRVNLLKM